MATVARGYITAIDGPMVEVEFVQGAVPPVYAALETREARRVVLEVVQHTGRGRARAVALEATEGLAHGAAVEDLGGPVRVPVGRGVLGRMLDALGRPLDGGEPVQADALRPVHAPAPAQGPSRRRAPEAVASGVRAIDLFAPLCRGGRNGLVGGAGLGKTTLLREGIDGLGRALGPGVVFAAVGDRSAEAAELFEWMRLGSRGQAAADPRQFVMVCAPMGEPPGAQARAALTALTEAEALCEELGRGVLLVVDDVSRMARSGAEVLGLLSGRPGALGRAAVVAPEVREFGARLRAAPARALTTLEAVHLPADEADEPGAAAVLDELDATVVLSRALAAQGVFPAVDPLGSRSALLRPEVVGARHCAVADAARSLLQQLAGLRDAVLIAGPDALSDDDRAAFERARRLQRYLSQPLAAAAGFTGRAGVFCPLEATLADVEALLSGAYDEVPERCFLYARDLREVKERAARAAP